MSFTARLFSFEAKDNDYIVHIYGSGSNNYSFNPPELISTYAFSRTCALYDSSGSSLATATHSSWLSSFDGSLDTPTITISTSIDGLGGKYDLKYICTLDDDDSSSVETPLTIYLVEPSATAQAEIYYILSQDVIT